jgi:hypothetical protein
MLALPDVIFPTIYFFTVSLVFGDDTSKNLQNTFISFWIGFASPENMRAKTPERLSFGLLRKTKKQMRWATTQDKHECRPLFIIP